MRRWRTGRILVGLASVSLVAAACGGGGKSAAPTTTASTASEQNSSSTTETTLAPTETSTTAVGATSTTAKGTTGATTRTTLKSTTTTAKKKAAPPLINVVAGTSTTLAADQPQPQPGGTLTYLLFNEITGFDPVVMTGSGGSDGERAVAVYDNIVYNNAQTGQVDPGTAESFTSADGVNWQLKLRPGIKFTDGTDYDANAVKFTWDRHADPANRSAQIGNVTAMTYSVVDPLTVRITLKNQNNQLPRLIGRALGFIASPKAVTEKGASYMQNPVGAGPFMLKDWTRDSSMTLVRNPNYWNKPLPYADQLVIKTILDEDQRTNSFLNGEGNLNYTSVVQTQDKLRKGGYPDITIVMNGGNDVVFNTTKAPFNDVRVRKAFAESLDTAKFNKDILGGLNPAVDTLFRPDSAFYDATVKLPAYNPTDAQKLWDQVAAANGGPTKITLGAFSTTQNRQTAEWIQANMASFNNVSVSIDIANSSAAITRVISKNYQAHLWGLQFDDPDPVLPSFFLSANAASSNVTGYSDSQMDAALNAGRNTFDPAKRAAAYKDVQRIVADQVPTWIYQRPFSSTFGAKNIRNLQLSEDGVLLPDRVWIDRKS